MSFTYVYPASVSPLIITTLVIARMLLCDTFVIDIIERILSQVGDCGAVLGSCNSTLGEWSAELLVKPHNTSNLSEIERIEGEHPISESHSIIREDRLLGIIPFCINALCVKHLRRRVNAPSSFR